MSILSLVRMRPFEIMYPVKQEVSDCARAQARAIDLSMVSMAVHLEVFYLLRSELSQLIDDQVREAL